MALGVHPIGPYQTTRDFDSATEQQKVSVCILEGCQICSEPTGPRPTTRRKQFAPYACLRTCMCQGIPHKSTRQTKHPQGRRNSQRHGLSGVGSSPLPLEVRFNHPNHPLRHAKSPRRCGHPGNLGVLKKGMGPLNISQQKDIQMANKEMPEVSQTGRDIHIYIYICIYNMARLGAILL